MYPKGDGSGDDDGRRGEPAVPGDRGARAGLLGARTTPSGPRSSATRPGVDGANEFVFYDGPPFANGLPHYGHLLTGYVKDIVPRYQTMRGHRVERRFGWDTHGLPAELEAMAQLGLKTKDDILELGIEEFNKACRASVLKYTGEWRDYVTRQARWVDFDNDYKTMDPTFMESVLWAFKTLYDKGYVYEGLRVLPYCWNDETPLSNHELRMDDDVYQMRQDPAVTVGLPARHRRAAADLDHHAVDACRATRPSPSGRTSTTSWSSTTAAGSSSPSPGSRRTRASSARTRPSESCDGSRVLSWSGGSYTPPFSYFLGNPGSHRVLAADFVSTDEGTGLVHESPAFGEEDMVVCQANGITAVVPGRRGAAGSPARCPDYAGMHVFEANAEIIKDLKARTPGEPAGSTTEGTVLLRHETYDHSYPHCWRCRNPLIYKAVSSWFVEVTKFKDRMGELNQEITWVPEHVKDGQFGKWLSNARDWSISRNRFWGSPIPVWKSDDPAYPRVDVYGSLAELEARLRGAGDRPAPAVHRRADPAQPGRPDRPLDHAPDRGRARRVVRLRVDALRPGALPVREPRLVRAPLPGRLHRGVHRPDPRLVLHAAHPGHRALRPAGLRDLHEPRHRARQRRAEDEQVAEELPRRLRGLRPRRRRRDALVPDVLARSCAAATWSSPSRASATACARCCCRCGTPGTSSRCTPTLPATRRSGRPRAPTCSTATCWPRRTTWSWTSSARWTSTTWPAPARACASTSTS